jgi:apolipoprotein N-acyltransferase
MTFVHQETNGRSQRSAVSVVYPFRRRDMTLKHLFTINAAVSALFGFSLILAPGTVCAFYGQHLDASGYSNTRMWGTAVFGFAFLTWLCRNAEDSDTRRRMVLALFCYFTIGFAACLLNFWNDPQPLVAWTTPLLYLLFAAGYGYFHFIQQVQPRDSISLIGIPK